MARGVVAAFAVVAMLLAAAAVRGAVAKECTNTFPAAASHTERAAAQLRASPPGAGAQRLPWVVVDHGHGHEQHLTPSDESTWMELMQRSLLAAGGGGRALPREADWLMLYRKLRGGAAVDGPAGAFLSEASLHDVRLEPGTVYWQAQQTNLEYLLLLDADRLVWSFRAQAGLPATGTPYGIT